MTTGRPAGPATTAPAGGFTHAQVLTILSGLMLGMFLAALDQNIVATSSRTIADDLEGLSQQAWLTTAYLITGTITTPIFGKLGDLYGRRRLMLWAITIFVTGSALCTLAPSMPALAVFRALQGLGAGGLIPLALAIIGDVVSPRERARYTGYFMSTFATASVLGPLIGGLLSGQESILGIAGWRWVFLVNVPVGLVAFLVVLRNVRLPAPTAALVRVDWWGAALLAVGLVPLLALAEQGREWGWSSGRSLVALAVGVVGLAGFAVVERRMGAAALLPFGLFRTRVAGVTVASSLLLGVAMFGGMALIPLYVQIVHGRTPTEAGLLMLPTIVGMMVAAIASARVIGRTGNLRGFPIAGSATLTVALVLMSTTTADTPLGWVLVPLLLVGLGLGQAMQPLMITMQNAVPPSDIGVATSSVTFARQIGGTVGVAMLLAVLFGTVGASIDTAIEDAARATPSVAERAGDPTVARTLERVQDDSSLIATLDAPLARAVTVGFADAMDEVFLIAAGAAGLAFLVLLLMPPVHLRETPAPAAGAGDGTASDVSGPAPPRS